METTSKPIDIENPFSINSPNTNESANTKTNNMDFVQNQNQNQIQTPPLTPRSDHPINPYATTFVQANTSTFKQVVQMLTGSSSPSQSKQNPDSNNSNYNKNPIPPFKTSQMKQQQQGTFKLYERRNQLNIIKPLINNNNNNGTTGISNFSPRKREMILSPSLLDFPNKLVLSSVTPLNEYLFNNNNNNNNDNDNNNSSNSTSTNSSLFEEDKAIAEKGFYLHQSPVNTPRECQPELLPLFPVTSPRVSGSSS